MNTTRPLAPRLIAAALYVLLASCVAFAGYSSDGRAGLGIRAADDPPDSTWYKAGWPDYSPSGMPDFEQDRVFWPLTLCGPTAVADSFWWFDSELECDRDRTRGDTAETEPNNNTCNQANVLGEVPAIPASLLAMIEDVDWYHFDVPPKGRGGYGTCSVVISTCALRQPGDADTRLEIYDGCTATGTPGKLIASNDNACAPDLQSEIRAKLEAGFRYWVRVWGFGDPYTLSLGIDCYPMVRRYGPPDLTPDDHSEQNPKPLIEDLALCMNTDDRQGTGSGHLGTRVGDMQACIDSWLVHNGIGGSFTEQTALAPAFADVFHEIQRSEDVVLLLGFYRQDPLGGGSWTRCGGHYVTAAGIDAVNHTIALSDPKLNNAEPPPVGTSGPGRVLGPKHVHLPGTQPADHDDPVNVSHDLYPIGPSQVGLPASQWALPSYGTAGGRTVCSDVYLWCMSAEYGQNPSPLPVGTPDVPCPNSIWRVSTEIEAMVTVSPLQTPICVFLSGDPWPDNLRVDKGLCPNPGIQAVTHDVIRGKICNPDIKLVAAQVDLGQVQCLYDDSPLDRFDELSPDHTDCFGGWFYLIRQSSDSDYGNGYQKSSGSFLPRLPASGGCP